MNSDIEQAKESLHSIVEKAHKGALRLLPSIEDVDAAEVAALEIIHAANSALVSLRNYRVATIPAALRNPWVG